MTPSLGGICCTKKEADSAVLKEALEMLDGGGWQVFGLLLKMRWGS